MAKSWCQSVTVLSIVGFFVLSCGVKEKPIGSGQPNILSGDLPKGVVSTKERKFLVRPSTSDFQVGEVTILYKIVTDEIDLPSTPEYSFEVKYRMPEMPEMPVTPATIQIPSSGQFKVTYDISMGGLWEVTLTVKKHGSTIDSLTYSFTVPE